MEKRIGRQCAFCGGRPVTKEHGLPIWLEKFLPGRTIKQINIQDDHIPRSRGIRCSVAGAQVRGVCAQCNNRWMSQLEMAAKPIVGPMVAGRRTHLSQEAQTLLANWLLKTCLVHTLADSGFMREYFPSVYTDYFTTQSPSEIHYVSVSAFTGEKWATVFNQQLLVICSSSESDESLSQTPTPNAYLLTLVVGQFIGQVFCLPGCRKFGSRDTRQQFVWPYQGGHNWPPHSSYTAADLQDLARTRFATLNPHPGASSLRWTNIP